VDALPAEELRLTVAEASEWKQNWKYYKYNKPEVMRTIKILQSNLKGRDHIFFIENSTTMGPRAAQVLEAFDTLAYIAKRRDETKVELALSSTVKEKIHSNANVTPLMEVVKECRYDQIGCFMEERLTHLIDNVIMDRLLPARPPKKNPISLIVFTDGQWGKDAEGAVGVENAIKRLIDRIQEHDLPRTQVMIQFIRFGDDEDGKRHLKYLVEFGKKHNW
jgi:hypothetical protein